MGGIMDACREKTIGTKIVKDEWYKPIYFYSFCLRKVSRWEKLPKTG